MSHSKANYLRGWIYAYFGGFQQLAEALGLSTSTVSDWTTQNPRNMLKYSPEVSKLASVTLDEITDAVLRREDEMKEELPTS